MKGKSRTTTNTLLLVGGIFLAASGTAHASYLDPGSASYLFQVAIAGVLGGMFTLRSVWERLKQTHGKAASKKREQ